MKMFKEHEVNIDNLMFTNIIEYFYSIFENVVENDIKFKNAIIRSIARAIKLKKLSNRTYKVLDKVQ